MNRRTAQLTVALPFVILVGATPFAATKKTPARMPAPKVVSLPCGDYVGFQVLLDREGFSPGEIDGRAGANFSHALAALQTTRQLPATGQPDCDTWHALGGERPEPAVTTYSVTDDDV